MYNGDITSVHLPRLILIADRFTNEAPATRAMQAVVEGGVSWIHLRDHQADPETFRREAGQLVVKLRAERPDLLVSINSDLHTAHQLGTGLHLGRHGPGLIEARTVLGPDTLIGYSAHQPEDTSVGDVDYYFFSPIYPTSSKPGTDGIGLETLSAFCSRAARPVYALGGITPERVQDCLNAGAYGVAMLSGILNAPDPAAAVYQYQMHLAEAY
jgi:thiamine-phosphate pyrophosphorylase